MKLIEWRKLQRLTQVELANELEVSQTNIATWENERSVPSPKLMRRIIELTKGAVMPNDFYNEIQHN